MAFKEHPAFPPPSSSSAIIWRYMDLAKFLSLIDKSVLFFVRVDKLTDLDPYEGFYTAPPAEVDNLRLPELRRSWGHEGDMDEEMARGILTVLHKHTQETARIESEVTFVNSWHAQEHESAAMWNQYVKIVKGLP
jgi:hypothetical protein